MESEPEEPGQGEPSLLTLSVTQGFPALGSGVACHPHPKPQPQHHRNLMRPDQWRWHQPSISCHCTCSSSVSLGCCCCHASNNIHSQRGCYQAAGPVVPVSSHVTDSMTFGKQKLSPWDLFPLTGWPPLLPSPGLFICAVKQWDSLLAALTWAAQDWSCTLSSSRSVSTEDVSGQ